VGGWATSTIYVRAGDGREIEVAGTPGAAEMLDPFVGGAVSAGERG
jgi:hypothetical protein